MPLLGNERDTSGGFAERLQSLIPEGRGQQTVLAKRAQIAPTSMSKYVNGTAEPELQAAARLARVLEIDLLWLATGEGSASAERGGHVGVPIYDVRLAAGTASLADGAQLLGEMPFDRNLLRQLGRTSAELLGVLEADGDSMEPLIADGARVVIDFADTRLREGVFGFRMGDELRIKRLRRTVDGVEILSENPRYPPEQLSGHQLEQFAVIGRALWAGSIL